MISKLLNDITTGKDNSTHEIIRVFMVMVALIMLVAFIVGTAMEIIHSGKTGQFDLQSYFQAVMTFVVGVGTFLLSGAAAIKLKQSNEPQPTGAAS